jgi:hypothetical protein
MGFWLGKRGFKDSVWVAGDVDGPFGGTEGGFYDTGVGHWLGERGFENSVWVAWDVDWFLAW